MNSHGWKVLALALLAVAAAACGDADGSGPTDDDARVALLAESCRGDDFAACDELWRVTEVGSELERLAASCNGNAEVSGEAAPFGDCVARYANGQVTTTTRRSTTTRRTTTTPDTSVVVETTAAQSMDLGEPDSGIWVVILRSVEVDSGREVAETFAAQLRDLDVETGVFLSSDYGSLNPGFWVVYTGGFDDPDPAIDRCRSIQDLVPDCYHRLIER